MVDDVQLLLNTAIKAAVRGGKSVYRLWGDLDIVEVDQKSCWKDLVTTADKEAEKIIIKTILDTFPEHYIISEEGTDNPDSVCDDLQWAIDPLDGTTNFCHNYPYFCTSVGILYKGEAIVGVVYDPTRDELFTAVKGQGAYLNGRPIETSKVNDLKESLLVTGFAYSRLDEIQKAGHELFTKYNSYCHGVRRDGAAALDLCYVAAGRLEGFWEYGLKVWDVTAGSVIVREAGGIVSDPTDLSHEKFDYFAGKLLATNGKIHNTLASEIHEATIEYFEKVS